MDFEPRELLKLLFMKILCFKYRLKSSQKNIREEIEFRFILRHKNLTKDDFL